MSQNVDFQDRKNCGVKLTIILLFLFMLSWLFLWNRPSLKLVIQTQVRPKIVWNTTREEIVDGPQFFIPSLLQNKLNLSFDPQNCKPKTKFGFMKTHKTGSSTVLNILCRFGFHNDLKFVVPENAFSFVRGNQPFQSTWLNNVPWHQYMTQHQLYNIATLHAVWNKEEYSKVLGPEAKFFTIVRKPDSAFESCYSYFGYDKMFRMPLPRFINRTYNEMETKDIYNNRLFNVLNRQLQDLGLPQNQVRNQSRVANFINEINSDFDLVMIMEHMQESLVLLADLLCLPLFIVAGLTINTRKPELKVSLSPSDSEKLIKLQSEEEKLYQFFLDKFESRIEIFGQARMNASVAELNRLNNILQNTCVTGQGDRDTMKDDKYKPWTNMVQMWVVNEEIKECPLLAMKENALINTVRNEQKRRWSFGLRNNSLV